MLKYFYIYRNPWGNFLARSIAERILGWESTGWEFGANYVFKRITQHFRASTALPWHWEDRIMISKTLFHKIKFQQQRLVAVTTSQGSRRCISTD